MEWAIDIHNLSKSFGTTLVLDNLSMRVKQGSFFGLLGRNGAGKTTTIKLLTGSLHPSAGEIIVLNHKLPQQSTELKSHIGLVSDQPALFEYLTPVEYLRFVGGSFGMPRSETESKIQNWLDLMSMSSKADSLCSELSHGMRKIVEFIAALMHEPDLLILDEPFSGIDPVNSRLIKDVLIDRTREGTTVFFSSHIIEVVERLCDEVAIIDQGKLLAHGSVDELLRSRSETGTRGLEDLFIELVASPVGEDEN